MCICVFPDLYGSVHLDIIENAIIIMSICLKHVAAYYAFYKMHTWILLFLIH